MNSVVDAGPVAVQLTPRPGVIELGFGQPDPALLPYETIRAAADSLLGGGRGAEAASYGAERGPETLIEAIAERIGRSERKPSPTEMLITGGNSQALDELLGHLALPGDPILVEAPTYNFALAIMRSRGLEPIGVALDDRGIRLDLLEDTIDRLGRQGRRPKLLYVIPTFHNPTGVSLDDSRREELLAFAATHDLTILEDDAYRELAYDGVAPESLWSVDPSRVIRFGTVSKSLAPGLRVGWITADERLVKTLELAGLRQSGGGLNHFAAMIVGEIVSSGAYGDTAERLRREYKRRRNALLVGLEACFEAGSFVVPRGGYFVWVELPQHVDTSSLLSVAEAHGVAFVPGRPFFTNEADGNRYVRLAFAYYPPDALQEGASRLGRSVAEYRMTR